MLTGICSMATRQVLADLAAQYQAESGVPVAIDSVGGVEAAKRVQAGAPLDFVVLAADALDALIASGSVGREGRVDVARSAMAMAVRERSSIHQMAGEADLGRAMLAARHIGYSTGPSGTHVLRLLERLGLMEALRAKLVQAPPGVPVGSLIARGEVDVGFQQLSELVDVPGIEIVHLPASAQAFTTFSAGTCTVSGRKREAAAFLAFLASSSASAAKLRRGMEPAQGG
jgi:molybdate transport system substrate-binding protein